MSVTSDELQEIAFCSSIDEIEDINISNKGLQELGAICRTTNLISLNLAFNAVKSLGGISNLVKLQLLNVSHNQVTSIKDFSALYQLTSLNVSHNKLKNLAPLTSCERLQDIYVQHNEIGNLEDVECLRSLSNLRRLCFHPNPASRRIPQEQYRYELISICSQLEVLDAKLISVDERQKSFYSVPSKAGVHNSKNGIKTNKQADNYLQGSKGTALPSRGRSGRSSSLPSSRGQSSIIPRNPSQSSLPGSITTSRRTSQSGSEQLSLLGETSSVRSVLLSRPSSAASQALTPTIRSAGSSPSILPALGFKAATDMLPKFEGAGRNNVSKPPSGASKKKTIVAPPSSHIAEFECRYPAPVNARALTIRRDGSLIAYWPSGEVAVTVDPDFSLATSPSNGDELTTAGYRMFASYSGSGIVAASWDANGGCVQYPNGSLFLSYSVSGGRGSTFSPTGTVLMRWRVGSGASNPSPPPPRVEAVLSTALAVAYAPESGSLGLYLLCGGLRCKVLCGRNQPPASWTSDGDDGPASPEFLKQFEAEAGAGPSAQSSTRNTAGGRSKEAVRTAPQISAVSIAEDLAMLDARLQKWGREPSTTEPASKDEQATPKSIRPNRKQEKISSESLNVQPVPKHESAIVVAHEDSPVVKQESPVDRAAAAEAELDVFKPDPAIAAARAAAASAMAAVEATARATAALMSLQNRLEIG